MDRPLGVYPGLPPTCAPGMPRHVRAPLPHESLDAWRAEVEKAKAEYEQAVADARAAYAAQEQKDREQLWQRERRDFWKSLMTNAALAGLAAAVQRMGPDEGEDDLEAKADRLLKLVRKGAAFAIREFDETFAHEFPLAWDVKLTPRAEPVPRAAPATAAPHSQAEPAPPPEEVELAVVASRHLYDCGCSHHKVQAGQCDIYAPDGSLRAAIFPPSTSNGP